MCVCVCLCVCVCEKVKLMGSPLAGETPKISENWNFCFFDYQSRVRRGLEDITDVFLGPSQQSWEKHDIFGIFLSGFYNFTGLFHGGWRQKRQYIKYQKKCLVSRASKKFVKQTFQALQIYCQLLGQNKLPNLCLFFVKTKYFKFKKTSESKESWMT